MEKHYNQYSEPKRLCNIKIQRWGVYSFPVMGNIKESDPQPLEPELPFNEIIADHSLQVCKLV